jgi:single-strand DNA-binding protein
MAEGYNQVYLLGNVGSEPKLVETRNGKGLFLRIATTKVIFDRESGSKRETTEWHDVAIWGKRGESLGRVITKGMRLMIIGELAYRQRDVGGTNVSVATVRAKDVFFVGGRNGGRSSGQQDTGDW